MPVSLHNWLLKQLSGRVVPLKKEDFLKHFPAMMQDLRRPRPVIAKRNASHSQKKTSVSSATVYASGTPPRIVGRPTGRHDRLPSAYRELDTNRDGQIDFSEWISLKRKEIGQFRSLDKNGDDVLSFRELSGEPATVATASSAKPASPSAKPASSSPEERTAGAAGPTSYEKLSDEQKRQYREMVQSQYFSYMDANRDGKLQPEEWNVSRRIKPLFEKAGVNLSREMTADEFTAHYARIVGTEDRNWKRLAERNRSSGR